MMIFNILFNQGYVQDLSNKDKPVRFLFTDYSRLSSVGGETSLAEMVGALRSGFFYLKKTSGSGTHVTVYL